MSLAEHFIIFFATGLHRESNMSINVLLKFIKRVGKKI